MHDGLPAIFFRRQVSEAFKWSRPLGACLNQHVADFDVVHVHAVFSHSSIAAGRACRARRVPYIVRPLGTLDPWSVRRKRLQKTILFRLGVDDLLSGAAAMHYTSDEEQRLAESVVPGLRRGVVVPLGIDDEYFESRVDPTFVSEEPYALSISRLHEKKAHSAKACDTECDGCFMRRDWEASDGRQRNGSEYRQRQDELADDHRGTRVQQVHPAKRSRGGKRKIQRQPHHDCG